MPADRLLRILSRLRADGGTGARLCEVCVEVVGVTGAGIMLMAGDAPRASVCSSDATSARIEDLQYTLGEGPCIEAHRDGRAVAVVDLSVARTRWPAFTPAAVGAGARAVFGFPMRVGAVRLGALNLYRDRTGPLPGESHLNALVMAEVAARWILAAQAGVPAGELAAALDVGTDLRLVVHQASGMVSVQADIDVAEALVRFRAYAFATDRRLDDVAEDVVARRLRFE